MKIKNLFGRPLQTLNRNVRHFIPSARRFTALTLIYSLGVLTLTIGSASAQNGNQPEANQISPEAAMQIQSLLDEKNSRTPAQQKIDSQLIYAIKMRRGEMISAFVPSLAVNVGATDAGLVIVDISALVDKRLLGSLRELGAKVVSSSAEYQTLRVEVSLEQLETIAALPQVRFIQPKQESTTNREENSGVKKTSPVVNALFSTQTSAAGYRSDKISSILSGLKSFGIGSEEGGGATNLIPNGYNGVGARNAEGVIAHQVYSARGTFNVDGTGIRIGVISDSVTPTALAASQASGDLPPTCSTPTPPANEQCVQILPGQGGSTTTGNEGTAMLEIVHDIAPGAQLYFATANPTIAQFAANIRTLRTVYNCDIIVDDVGYFAETPIQDGQTVPSNTNGGVVTQAVNDVTAAGAMYFSSAANSGNKNDGTSGTWEGDFTSAGTLALVPGGNVNDFDQSAGVSTNDQITVAGSGPINLYWSDPLAGSSNDYDLFVLNAGLTAVNASSTNLQTGTQDPYEQIGSAQSVVGRRIVVLQKTGAANRFLHLGTNRGQIAFNTPGETHGHAAASGGNGVAATPAYSPFNIPQYGPFPGIFTASSMVETFSSDGPRRSFYNGNGVPFTPGNLSSTGGLLIQQPVMTAADGEEVTGNIGFSTPFFGTSAAAPTAAAIAGLLKSNNPALTPAQVRAALTSTAVDIETPGVDQDAGAGVILAYNAFQAIGATGKAFLEFNGYTVNKAGGSNNPIINPGESGVISVNLKNTGLANATGVTATLTSTSPNFVVRQGATSFADLAASGGTSGSTANFAFDMSRSAPVDQPANFNLTLTYGGGWNATVTLNFSVQTGRQPVATVLDATAPPTSLSYPVTATGTQTSRISRADPQSQCGVARAYPGTVALAAGVIANFDSYNVPNPTSSPVCATITLTPDKTAPLYLQAVAYNGSYDPANVATNYLGDIGTSQSPGLPKSFSVVVPANSTLVVVVDNPNAPGGINSPYTLQVAGVPFLSAPTASTASVAGRVLSGRRPVGDTRVTMTDESGATRSAITNASGYYRFEDVAVGMTYVFRAKVKRVELTPQVLTVGGDVTELNFVSQ